MGRWDGLLEAARPRLALWLPVLLGLGIALYFALPAEPPPWLAPAWLLGLSLLLALTRRVPGAWALALAGLTVALGFQLAVLRSGQVAAPVLEREIGPRRLEATVERVERNGSGRRLWLVEAAIPRLPAGQTPQRLRVTLRGLEPPLRPGDRVGLLAVLRPPPGPAAPGGYDFARRAWFLGLGAVGFALGAPELLAPSPAGGLAERLVRLREDIRQAVAERILAVLPDRRGAVAAALMVGERGAIPQATLDALRDSSLAHLLAISGLHVGLAAGTVFFGLRALLAAIPGLALRRPIKKWAAAAALASAFLYLQLAGATVTVQRAFVMVGLVLLAVLLDRTALSMRLVAWAAALVLLLTPESLLGASFQMSFAAVVALIAAWEARRERLERGRPRSEAWWRRPLAYAAALAFTSLIAGLATAPFAVYHFNRLALYGLAANLLAVPLAAFWVMPTALLVLLAMPLGLDAPFLWLHAQGVGAILWVGDSVAAWPGAVALVPAMPLWGLGAVALGGLWLCLWRPTTLRLAGLPLLLLGLASPWTTAPPDLLVAEDGRLLALRGPDGGLALSSRRRARFVAEQWLRQAATAEPLDWPAPPWLRCDGQGCLAETPHGRIALPSHPLALPEDCRTARILVTSLSVPRACGQGLPAPELIVDRWQLRRTGGQAIHIDEAGIRVETTRERRGERPWVRRAGLPRLPPWEREVGEEGAEE